MYKLLTELSRIEKMHRHAFWVTGSSIIFWFVIFHDSIISAAKVWWVSDIYSHGFFILPIAAYLAWRKRYYIAEIRPKPAYIAIIPLLFDVLIYIIGVAGNIKLFQHAAAFSILPLTIWFVFGTKIAKIILFPLLFILFSIPFGEEFIPLLQKITADNSVWLLRILDIPVFRNGLYIEIPNGKFVVAEACSGVRFFVGAVVFGAIYAYISYTSRLKQFVFFAFAFIVPIIANSIRVSVIILIGYLSDMKYATGVDHLVYGWIFFAIVIALLVIIGNIWADETIAQERVTLSNTAGQYHVNRNIYIPFLVTIGIYLIMYFWTDTIDDNMQKNLRLIERVEPIVQGSQDKYWKPINSGASKIIYGNHKISNEKTVDCYSAFYPYNTPVTELISSENRLYDPDDWTLKSSKTINIKLKTQEHIDATLLSLVGSNQEYRYILYWYEVGSFKTSSKVMAKLFQSLSTIIGNPGSGRIVIYSSKYTEEDKESTRDRLIAFAMNGCKE